MKGSLKVMDIHQQTVGKPSSVAEGQTIHVPMVTITLAGEVEDKYAMQVVVQTEDVNVLQKLHLHQFVPVDVGLPNIPSGLTALGGGK